MYCSKCSKEIIQGEKFCTNCGTAAYNAQVTQNNYAYNPQDSRDANPSSSISNYNKAPYIIGVILLIAGIIGAIFAGATIAGDISDYNHLWGYSYRGHLTSHEIQMIMTLIVSIIGGFIGLIMTIANRKK